MKKYRIKLAFVDYHERPVLEFTNWSYFKLPCYIQALNILQRLATEALILVSWEREEC